MKDFAREDLLFSLCGLNCGLCGLRLGGHCPGCGGGAGNQACAIARCSLQHGGVAYCYQCKEYPCERYAGDDPYDLSFITHRNRRKDMERAQAMGPAAYRAEQEEKGELLQFLLANLDDGRRKGLFCLAVNLLDLQSLRGVVAQLTAQVAIERPLKERAAQAADLLQAAAQRQGIVLKLNKKPGK